ncbi:hypothetical protein OPIT5_29295 [Opitutaceae bacterium TAV5]|nr:hypothetical protein OPIT5_21825 [Opitutaceae bacterium TAV5]AHF94883.1 hypothetical protein OPIT5_29295 [Opitutaceae bacterium TAV5]
MPSRLSTIVSKSTIQEYAQGAAQSAAAPVADFLAPTVEVAKPIAYYKVYDDKRRFRVPNTRRAINGRAVEIGWEATDAQYNCSPHALDVPVDIIETDDENTMENSLREAADLGAAVGSLSHEKETIDTALQLLTPGLANLDFAADADVIDQIDERIIQVIKAARYGSLLGVRMLFGPTFFRRLKNHKSVKGRFLGAGSKKEAVNPTIDDLLSLFIAKPEIKLSMMVADEAPEGKPADVDFLLDESLIVFAASSHPTRHDPSFMKTFRLRGRWMKPGTYARDDGRVEVAKLDWSHDVKITNTLAAQLLKIEQPAPAQG